MSVNEELFERAQQLIPGGVNSPVRAFRSVGGTPYFVARAQGANLWDIEGNAYIDMVQSYGAIMLGHADPLVTQAIIEAAPQGTSYGAPTEREVLLAEIIQQRVPSCERVRFVSSGTEATMSAIRVARGYTGRNKIVKFAGNYHGHSDALLVSGGTGMATHGIAASAGVTPGAIEDTLVAPYNIVPTLSEEIAAVIVEPIAANMGLVAPMDGFLQGLRDECDRVGALLIFDEVITGFRVHHGGAQGLFGVTPDLTAFGKIIGGGLPVGAFGGKKEIMECLSPLGPVYQAGTLSGNPLATAAGIAALQQLTPEFYTSLTKTVEDFSMNLQACFDRAGREVLVPHVATLLGLFFGSTLPTNYEQACTTNEKQYAEFFHAMLKQHIALAPGAYEVLFVGAAHTQEILDQVLEATANALGI